MPSNFPTSPTVGQTYTYNSRTWIWDGSSWNPYLTSPSIKYGTYANLPATCNAGDLYYSSDHPHYFIATATNTWQTFFQGVPVTVPTASNFSTQVNIGSATFTQIGKFAVLTDPRTSGGYAIFLKSLPSAPYTIETSFSAHMNASNYRECCLILRSSSTSRFISFSWVSNAVDTGTIGLAKFTNETSYNSSYTPTDPFRSAYYPLIHFKIVDNGTNRIYYYSLDGYNWIQLLSTTNTDWTTPNQIGFGSQAASSLSPSKLVVYSYKEY